MTAAVGRQPEFVGLDTPFARLGGPPQPRRYLDSAASTLALHRPLQQRQQLLRHYGSPHTAQNAASDLCVAALRLAQDTVLRFFGFPAQDYHCLFVGAGATAALNRAAQLLARAGSAGGAAVTLLEHHSNDLPHRGACGAVTHVPADAAGHVDLEALEHILRTQRIAYVAVTACSNVTGLVTPLAAVAALARRHGCHLLVDGAQLAVHRRLDAATAIDAFVFSGHKAYAPGTPGVLVVRKELHERAGPVELGGGIVGLVEPGAFTLADDPDARVHAGTPDVLGAFQLAMALRELERRGFDAMVAREQDLLADLMARLQARSGRLRVYGDTDPARRVGVVSFNLPGVGHDAVAWALAQCFGIAVRNGCFCAQPYVRHLLGEDAAAPRAAGAPLPGMVRASLGAYTTGEDITALVDALDEIAGHPGRYVRLHRERGGGGAPGADPAQRLLQEICR